MQHQSPLARGQKAVSNWILIGVFMLLIQVVLGGVTRLTGSGLSITKWDIKTHALPPLSESKWITHFEEYRKTPQFRHLNTDFTLQEFKYIFFWEWLHRNWAQLIALVFIVGFIYLIRKKYLKKEMVRPLVILFLLGASQGAVGWIMVLSGLTGGAVYVQPTNLAAHFIFAMVLIIYALWFALQLRIPDTERGNAPVLQRWTFWLIALALIQLIFGALMAGHRAATAAPTWPDINGNMLPDTVWNTEHGLLNLIDNKITIHFIHRTLAYLLLVLVIIYSIKIFRYRPASPTFRKFGRLPVLLVCLQVILGILSLLASNQIIPNRWGAFEWMAQLHQVTGMLFLLSLVTMFYLTRRPAITQLS
jgi:cytochrome c oxidase assembly protein subunit 15